MANDLRLSAGPAERDGSGLGSLGAASLAVLLVGLPLGGLIWAATGGIPGTVHTPIAWVRLASSGARTLAISAVSAATCLVLGVPLAVAFNRFRFPGREALIAVAFVPFVLPTLAVAGGVSSLLGRGGWLEWLPGEPGNGLLGSVVAIVATNLVFNLGLVIRMVGPGVQALDSALVDSARVLGVPRSLAWCKVGLPSLRPVIVASGALLTLLAATNFGVVLILGSPASATVDLEIWYSVTQVFDLRSAAVMTFAQLAVLGLFVNWLMRRWGSTATSSVLGGARTHRPVALPPLSAATPVARFGVLLASAMVTAKSATTPHIPGLAITVSAWLVGFRFGTAKTMIAAGTSQFTTEGRNSAKNSKKASLPFCQTISVVMSPKGENAPPALAATTSDTQEIATKRGLSRPSAMTTAPMISAVVRLSSAADRKNASTPVRTKRARKPMPRASSRMRSTAKVRGS